MVALCDRVAFNDKVLIADDTILKKTGNNMELVSFHHDHKIHSRQLGYQVLQLGYCKWQPRNDPLWQPNFDPSFG